MTNKNPLIVESDLKEAGDQVNNVYKTLREVTSQGMKDSRDFYYRLSLLSGGIISLSITFVGYIVSIPNRTIVLPELLILGWFLLLVSLISSMYRNHFHGNFLHWQIFKKFAKSKEKEQTSIIDALTVAPQIFANISSLADKQELFELTKTKLGKYKIATQYNGTREKKTEKLWLITQSLAHIGFVAGVVCIAVFAAINLPVKYTLFQFVMSALTNGFVQK